MHTGGAVLRLRIDDFLVPYSPHDDQLEVVEVDVCPLQPTKFCERKTRPRGDHDRAPCHTVHRFRNLLDFLQRVLVRLLSPLTLWNLDAVCRVRTLKRSATAGMCEDCRQQRVDVPEYRLAYKAKAGVRQCATESGRCTSSRTLSL